MGISLNLWVTWGILLLVQQGSFTWVSRARNSGSPKYNFIASLFSNGSWWIGQAFAVGVIVKALQESNVLLFTLGGVYYTLLCAFASAGAQVILMKHVEKGKRKVGAT